MNYHLSEAGSKNDMENFINFKMDPSGGVETVALIRLGSIEQYTLIILPIHPIFADDTHSATAT